MSTPQLVVEILSAKALNVDDQRVSYLQLHVLYNHQIIRSSSTLCQTIIDPIFNYSCSFPFLPDAGPPGASTGPTSSIDNDIITNSHGLLTHESPILIYLTTTTDLRLENNCCGISSVKSLIAAAILDFRYSLLHSEEYISVELLPCELDGVHMGVSAGILYVRLKLQNFSLLRMNLNQFTRQEIEDSIFNYQNKIANENRNLYQIARHWWTKAIETYPHIQNHIFKIIAEDELGYHRSVCSLLYPIEPHRCILNPKFSARYVSLIPFRRDIGLTGGRVETWRSCHATMCRLQGDVEDHAILLCSMLMGWGLDAWIGLGTIVSPSQSDSHNQTTSTRKEYIHRPYCWVITFDRNSSEDVKDKEPKVIFWEAVSGKQYDIPHYQATSSSPSQPHVFGELHALFRNDCYLINVQQTSLVNGGYTSFFSSSLEPTISEKNSSKQRFMSFDLSNERYFLPFPRHAISPTLLHPGGGVKFKMNSIFPPILSESQLDPPLTSSSSSSNSSEPIRITFCKTQLMNSECVNEIEIYLEDKLKDFIATFRLNKDLYTHYDSHLSSILQVSLPSSHSPYFLLSTSSQCCNSLPIVSSHFL